MKQHTKLAILALIAAGVLIPTSLVLMNANNTQQPGERVQELDASGWYSNWNWNWGMSYSTYIAIAGAPPPSFNHAYYRVTSNESMIAGVLGVGSLYLANGSSIVFRGMGILYAGATTPSVAPVYLFRDRASGYWFCCGPLTHALFNQTYHENLLVSMAW